MKHNDFYNREINVGDLVLGASRQGRFGSTQFNELVVIGRTPQMIRVVQVGRSDDLESVERHLRSGRGGKAFPQEFILLQQGFVTEQQIKACVDAGPKTYDNINPDILGKLNGGTNGSTKASSF